MVGREVLGCIFFFASGSFRMVGPVTKRESLALQNLGSTLYEFCLVVEFNAVTRDFSASQTSLELTGLAATSLRLILVLMWTPAELQGGTQGDD